MNGEKKQTNSIMPYNIISHFSFVFFSLSRAWHGAVAYLLRTFWGGSLCEMVKRDRRNTTTFVLELK